MHRIQDLSAKEKMTWVIKEHFLLADLFEGVFSGFVVPLFQIAVSLYAEEAMINW